MVGYLGKYTKEKIKDFLFARKNGHLLKGFVFPQSSTFSAICGVCWEFEV